MDKRTTVVAMLAAAVLLMSACRSEPDEEALPTLRQTTEDLIRGDVASQAGLGDLSPVCPEVNLAVSGVGTTWDCTATTADQRVISLQALINQQGQVEVATTNMITAAALPSFERAAVQALNDTVGSRLEADAIDCGESTVVFGGPERVMVCALFDPATEATYDVSLTVDDIETRQFSLVVADQPRA
ncbi:MAG: hypothetical protein AAGA93_06465 [Actinomycetota bacterium]